MHQIKVINLDGTQILGGDGLPVSYHINLVYKPLEKVSLLFKIGRTLHLDFSGWEYGLNGKYEFIEPLYLCAGILEHSNEGGSSSISHGTEYASILMLQAGVGVNVSEVFAIEVDYYIPTSKKIIGRNLQLSNKAPFYWETYKFKNMVSLSFIFGWEL